MIVVDVMTVVGLMVVEYEIVVDVIAVVGLMVVE